MHRKQGALSALSALGALFSAWGLGERGPWQQSNRESCSGQIQDLKSFSFNIVALKLRGGSDLEQIADLGLVAEQALRPAGVNEDDGLTLEGAGTGQRD